METQDVLRRGYSCLWRRWNKERRTLRKTSYDQG